MDLEDDGGGVVFMDTLSVVPQQQPSFENGEKTTAPGTRSSSREARNPLTNTTEILAHAYQSATKSPDSQDFIPFTPEELSKLAKRYPRGNLFTFEQLGQGYSDSSDNEGKLAQSARNGKPQRPATAKPGMKSLQKHFPKARQIIFLPLWDSTTARSTACFVYNCSDYRNFTHQLEFLHCITFSNCIDTDLMRLANLKENEQKSDFIGSISHELRSPLHGILASCEFLQDTECTFFQQSLVNTANSCARTLLDTVNMVLDYSKINAFERSTGKTNSVSSADPMTNSEFLQANLSTSRHVDLAILTEEVVEGVATGHAYDDSLKHTNGYGSQVGAHDGRPSSPSNFAPCKPDVELIVDIPERDWTYWSEPGGLRRIIMNLVGNSLKYTKAGYVHIELATQDIDLATPGSECVVLTVTDSGQGMSPAYLKDKLFKPFAQESNQTPGVGLGLSLVKSIVSKIGGHIDIESTVGVGTKVTVKCSLTRATKTDSRIDSAVNSASSTDSAYSAADNSLRLLKTQAIGKTVALYLPENKHPGSDQQEAFRLMHKSLTAYLMTWCGFSVIQWHESSTADVVVTEEINLDALLRNSPQLSAHGCNTMVLVLRNTPSTQPLKTASFSRSRIEDIRHPFGPHKLARALCICLDRSRLIDTATKVADSTLASVNPLVDSITDAAAKLSISGLEPMSKKYPTIASENAKPHKDTAQETADATVSQEAESSKTIYESRLLIQTSTVEVLKSKSAVLNIGSISPAAQLTKPVGDQGLTSSNVKLEAGLQESATTTTTTTAAGALKRNLRALLVDDNTINLRLLQVGMKKRGYTAISNAENGLQAVNTYRDLLYASPSTPPDVVLMDLSMPVMNGFEATRKIREIEAEFNSKLPPSHAPQHSLIIALTGLASIRDQKEAFASGVDSYIMKPVKFARLTELLEDWTVDGKMVTSRIVTDTIVVAG
jgi:signal transduction histidine kinase/CheY-like chemotaxis protein